MIKLNYERIRDKIYSCWVGKNIGGTMGGPYEGTKDFVDVQGFITPKGEPLPNDDLDLQLIWLRALEEYGAYNLNEKVLGEYWISFIAPYWNEYGTAKCNLQSGLLPPISGEYRNEQWKRSNGAWIRSEIWACLTPGFTGITTKYACMDACIDHGMDEGTYAEIFTSTMECLAFFETDGRKTIDRALESIPGDCRTAKSVKLVIAEYEKGTEPRAVRDMLISQNEDMGRFQAPSNVAFVILGLLYGEFDFKKSMLTAISCGDDTDCTGATVGAFLGILYGSAGIPDDWKEYIGTSIRTVALSADCYDLPPTCDALTDRIMYLMPVVFKANGVNMRFTDGDDELRNEKLEVVKEGISYKLFERSLEGSERFLSRKPYSVLLFDTVYADAILEFEHEPVIAPNGNIKIKVKLRNKLMDPRHMHMHIYLPDGWSAEYSKDVFMRYYNADFDVVKEEYDIWEATITAGERVESVNKIVIEADPACRAMCGTATVKILGV